MLLPDGRTLGTQDLTQVGVDGGLLETWVRAPKTHTPDGDEEVLLLAPAERADVLIDLSRYPNSHVTLVDQNPPGDPIDILRFVVDGTPPATPPPAPSPQARSPRLAPLPADEPLPRRAIGLFTVGRMQTINGRTFHEAVEESPELGSTEIWEILNVTGEEHPIHLHLVNFEILDRRAIEVEEGTDPETFPAAFGRWRAEPSATRGPLPAGWRFTGEVVLADDNERGPKDTVRVPESAMTRLRVTFRLHTGLYMFHCHILEHEDMEMMRPLLVVPQGTRPMPAHHGHG